MDFKISEKFKTLIQPSSDGERSDLEDLLIKDGVRDPLVVWDEENILLDGHTRLSICEKHNLKYQVHRMSFPSEAHAEAWVIKNQMGRRNLTELQWGYLRGKRYTAEKAAHGGTGANQHTKEQRGQNELLKKGRKYEALAKEYGVGESTIKRDEKYSLAIDTISALTDNPTQTRQEILTGKKKLTKKAVKDIAIVADTDKEKARAMLKEGVMPKKKKKPKKQPESVESVGPVPNGNGGFIHSCAEQMVDICISQLTRIESDDPNKEAQLNRLIKWIEAYR